jgi:hypothetical protein
MLLTGWSVSVLSALFLPWNSKGTTFLRTRRVIILTLADIGVESTVPDVAISLSQEHRATRRW